MKKNEADRSIPRATNLDIFADEVRSERADLFFEDLQVLTESHFFVGDSIETNSIFGVREQRLEEKMTIAEKTCKEKKKYRNVR